MRNILSHFTNEETGYEKGHIYNLIIIQDHIYNFKSDQSQDNYAEGKHNIFFNHHFALKLTKMKDLTLRNLHFSK